MGGGHEKVFWDLYVKKKLKTKLKMVQAIGINQPHMRIYM